MDCKLLLGWRWLWLSFEIMSVALSHHIVCNKNRSEERGDVNINWNCVYSTFLCGHFEETPYEVERNYKFYG